MTWTNIGTLAATGRRLGATSIISTDGENKRDVPLIKEMLAMVKIVNRDICDHKPFCKFKYNDVANISCLADMGERVFSRGTKAGVLNCLYYFQGLMEGRVWAKLSNNLKHYIKIATATKINEREQMDTV